ncbi:hypothetical protein [Parvularcula oceani]|uniref:hypothetical protein n=1 Tax=Parvularcula oceani TaxID=1247963 RepID=UPI0004E26A6B|nr:hypothetical protein [Parvularcula oceani]
MRHALLTTAGALAALTGPAFAQSFSGEDVQNFIVVMEEMETLSERYPDEDLSEGLGIEPGDMNAMISESGEMTIFSRIADSLDGSTDAQQAARSAILENGFDSLPDWGETSDAIMMAYLATEMDPDDMAGMDQVTPEMMAMMPPSARAQMEAVMRMMDAIKSVPQDDIDTLRPYRGQLEDALDQ